MAAGFDRERFTSDWRELANPERAVAVAHEQLGNVLDGHTLDLADLELLLEAAWDGPGGDTKLALDATLKAQLGFRRTEAELRLSSPERIQLRYGPWLLVARAWFRYGNSRQALIETFGGIRSLEDLAGGRIPLHEIVGRPANAVGGAAVGFLGLYPAALRRAQLVASHRVQFHEIGLDLLKAYLGKEDEPTVYPRTAAVAAQWFYYLVHDLKADDRLVKALYLLDERTRPQDARGLATWDSLAMEYEKRFGDPSAAERHRLTALEGLARLPLLRHRKVVDEWGYLQPPPSP